MKLKSKVFFLPSLIAVIFMSSVIIIVSPVGNNSLVSIPSPTPEVIWKSYQDAELGISLEYPSDWLVSRQERYLSIYDPDAMFNFVSVSQENSNVTLPLSKWVEDITKTEIECKTPDCSKGPPTKYEGYLSLGGRQVEAFSNNSSTVLSVNYLSKVNNRLTHVHFSNFNNLESIGEMDKIVTSFKFLPDTSTWQTYKNDQLNFTFEYQSSNPPLDENPEGNTISASSGVNTLFIWPDSLKSATTLSGYLVEKDTVRNLSREVSPPRKIYDVLSSSFKKYSQYTTVQRLEKNINTEGISLVTYFISDDRKTIVQIAIGTYDKRFTKEEIDDYNLFLSRFKFIQ